MNPDETVIHMTVGEFGDYIATTYKRGRIAGYEEGLNQAIITASKADRVMEATELINQISLTPEETRHE